MGFFSFLCKKCGDPILYIGDIEDEVELFLLEDGEVIDRMSGKYDGYGCVSKKDGTSRKWARRWSNLSLRQGESTIIPEVCTLIHDCDEHSGIAAIHTRCFDGEIPTTESEDDPNQGAGEPDEDDEDACWNCGGTCKCDCGECWDCGECSCYEDEDEEDEYE